MRTLVRELVVAAERRRDAFDRDMRMVWHVAALQRQRRLPALKTLLARRPHRQSPAQLHASLEQLSAQYGIPLRHRPHAA